MSEKESSLSYSRYLDTLTQNIAFEPQADASLDEAFGLCDHHPASNNLSGDDNAKFDLVDYMAIYGDMSQYPFEDAAFNSELGLLVDSSLELLVVDPADLWKKSNQHSGNFHCEERCGVASSHAIQDATIGERNGRGCQQFEEHPMQINLVPECSAVATLKQASRPQESHDEDVSKRNRVLKARNAANKRHSMSKASQSGNGENKGADVGHSRKLEDPKLGRYREKNRIAAGKCRAKKRNHIEDLETRYMQESATHTYLKDQELELRNMLTFLRECSLQHEPSGCYCDSLRQYNIIQAQKIARKFGSPNSLTSQSPSSENQMTTQMADRRLGGPSQV